jgi:hypothetical protein
MHKIRLKGFKKSQNNEDYVGLLKATGGQESPYALPEQTPSVIEEVKMENLDSKVAGDFGRDREYYRQVRKQDVHEKIAKQRLNLIF